MNDRTRRILIATLIAIALFAFTAWRIRLQLFDAGETPLTYVDLADRIRFGEMPEIADVSPVYLGLMVVLRRLGLSVPAIVSMQLAALTLAALCCALVAKRFGGWPAAIATAVLILGNRAAFVLATQLDPKTLILLLTSAALALLSRDRWWTTSLAAMLLGLNGATHPYGYLILFVVALFHRRVAMLAALLPVVLVLAFTPRPATHSSTQFYEGNNPLATGAGGVSPISVARLQAAEGEASPDPAYRRLAVDWSAKAMANLRAYPRAAMKRFAWKALLTIHNFDVYDLEAAVHTSMRLPRFPSIPFGLAFALAIAALVLHRRRRDLAPFACLAAVLMIALTVFVVSARQRNVLLVPLAILGGVGAAAIVTLMRERMERGLLAFGAVLIATTILGIEGRPMREHAYQWMRIAPPDAPEFLFDRAIEMQHAGQWLRSEVLLSAIEDYRPLRGNEAVSSVAYYRARAAMQLHMDDAVIRRLLDEAEREAPGDPFVLALRGVTIDRAALRRLDELHDPMTRGLALAVAERRDGG
ncbi:MAG TPA: hypothetical protein VHW00_24010 [Thermoanaerobaculia bacterium]|nr:hypothetical protein [Thermoanaerobaculia bacterium]